MYAEDFGVFEVVQNIGVGTTIKSPCRIWGSQIISLGSHAKKQARAWMMSWKGEPKADNDKISNCVSNADPMTYMCVSYECIRNAHLDHYIDVQPTGTSRLQ